MFSLNDPIPFICVPGWISESLNTGALEVVAQQIISASLTADASVVASNSQFLIIPISPKKFRAASISQSIT